MRARGMRLRSRTVRNTTPPSRVLGDGLGELASGKGERTEAQPSGTSDLEIDERNTVAVDLNERFRGVERLIQGEASAWRGGGGDGRGRGAIAGDGLQPPGSAGGQTARGIS